MDSKYGEWGTAVDYHKAHPKKIRPWLPWVVAALVLALTGWGLATVQYRHARRVALLPLTRDPDIGIASAGDVPASTVRVGDCIVDLPSETYGRAVGLGRCDENHYSEVVGIIQLSGGYDAARLTSDARSGCAPKLAHYDDAGYLGTAVLPSETAWRHGVLGALCLASDPRHEFLSEHVAPSE